MNERMVQMDGSDAPLIGLTTERNDRNEALLPVEYVDAVRRAGGIPVLLPAGEPHWQALLERLDGLILTGGGDVDPAHYGSNGHAAIYEIDPARDVLELALARAAVASALPLFGVCRGAQVINVALGGTLVEHLPDEVGPALAHRAEPSGAVPHPVQIEPDSHLAALLGDHTTIGASWHHQAIRAPAPTLRVTAYAPDGTIEAVESPAHPWLVAVQWHPEMTAARDAQQQRLFDDFVAAARRFRQARGK